MNWYFYKNILILWFLINTVILIAGQGQDKEQPELISADILLSRTKHGIQIRKLIGDVIFKQGDAFLRCDSATDYINQARVVLMGHVSIHRMKKELYADRIDYYSNERLEKATGNVKLVDSSKVLTCDTLIYDQIKEKITAKNNVVMRDIFEYTYLMGDFAEYHRSNGYAQVLKRPKFVKSDTTGATESTITGNSIEMYNNGERITVKDSVVITRDQILAYCDELDYLDEEQKVILKKSPIARRKRDLLLGDKIELLLSGTEIASIYIAKDALISSKIDTLNKLVPRYDLLTGENIFLNIIDDQIDSVRVKKQATSYYHVIEDGREKGLNKILGDELIMYFKDQEIYKVNVYGDPSVSEGVFYPVDIVSKQKIEEEILALLKMHSQKALVQAFTESDIQTDQ